MAKRDRFRYKHRYPGYNWACTHSRIAKTKTKAMV